MPPSVSDILAVRKPTTRQARLVFDPAKSAVLADLRRRLQAAKVKDRIDGGGLTSEAPELERLIAKAEEALDGSAQVFTFQAIGRRKLEEITNKYPPSIAQWDRFKEVAKANPLFPGAPPEFDSGAAAPEILAATAVEPTMTLEEARRLWDELSDGQAGELFNAAWGVNMEVTSRPTYGTGTDTTPNIGPASITPVNGESL